MKRKFLLALLMWGMTAPAAWADNPLRVEIDNIRMNRRKISPLKFKVFFADPVVGGLKKPKRS